MRVERINIPKERIAPAIGAGGEVRERIEGETGVELDFDSETGLVMIKGKEENPVGLMTARDVIKAIGRGFSPEKAFGLFNEEIYLDAIDITRYSGKSKKAKTRLKGRVIGRDGKTRRLIEEYTDTSLSIYGKTVACIGFPEKVQVVREAVHMLLDGAPHSAVYNFLEEKKEEAEKPLELWK
ncbi:hypothetical protein AKJ57_01710 [candidate division MSBL1 archaeon SCGC-AAA259A05]|uniref:K Homology domain-containing protein n=1 Tax=candidate division MSBL1 archaeon SCGC-AAA259A05 TaxID=1698259 RepID=A0A133UAU5_9EURY|nr:hypothetical protein AKJ57_01710 [candidate division MSBL1 archaeon SCGC-AAA259A05]